MVRIALVDDHPVLRAGVKALLSTRNDIEVVAEAADVASALACFGRCVSDIVLLDIRLGEGDGLPLISKAKYGAGWATKVIVLTSYAEEGLVRRAMKYGADGYLLKNATAECLFDAIDSVMEGKTYVSPEIGALLFGDGRLNRTGEFSVLSDEDADILDMLAEGKSGREIADALSYSERTVKRRIETICEALGAKNRTEAVSKAIRMGLL